MWHGIIGTRLDCQSANQRLLGRQSPGAFDRRIYVLIYYKRDGSQNLVVQISFRESVCI